MSEIMGNNFIPPNEVFGMRPKATDAKIQKEEGEHAERSFGPYDNIMFDFNKLKFERRNDKFDNLLSKNAYKINQEFRLPDKRKLILPDGRINPEVFDKYDPIEYLEKIRNDQIMFSEIDDENVKENRISDMRKIVKKEGKRQEIKNFTENINFTDEQIIEFYEMKQENKMSSKWEKAAVILLSRVLGSQFIVVRSSIYDDYHNGTDTIIVDKESGAVICAIDLVNDQVGGKRYDEKIKKFAKNSKTGGKIDFCITMEKDISGQNKLVRESLSEVPKFFLPVDERDLKQLLEETSSDYNASLIEIEKMIFKKIFAALDKQKYDLLNKYNPSLGVRQNLKKFQESLEKMKKIKENF